MRHIFIDLGAYDGDSIRYFLKSPESLKYEIYAFEPNPKFVAKLKAMKKANSNIKQVSNEAAWIEDGTMDFAVDQASDPMGSTLMKGKAEIWQKSQVETMITFDFSEWIKQFADDYVIVKMDIEGAEFPILDKMIKNNTLTIVKELWCEFHPNKVREYTTTDKINLMQTIRDHGVKLTEWH